jgi:integrase
MSENTLNAALLRLGYSKTQMTAHGFKGMASTRLNEMGRWNPDAIERQLAHQESDDVRRAYMHAAGARQDDAGLGRLSRRTERRRESHPVATRECLRERQAGVIALSRRKQGFESPRERQ